MKKFKVIIATLIPILAISACAAFGYYLEVTDPTRPLPLPKEESIENSVSLASDGCCFAVYNVIISMNDNDKKLNVLEKEILSQRERFDVTLPIEINSAVVSIHITFDYVYSNSGTETLNIMPSISVEELRKSGLLIYFQERGGMFMLVVNGNKKNLFYLSDDDEWISVDLDFKYYYYTQSE